MKFVVNTIILGACVVTVAWVDSDQQAVQDAVNNLQATIQACQLHVES